MATRAAVPLLSLDLSREGRIDGRRRAAGEPEGEGLAAARSVYGAAQRPNPAALVASIAACAGLVGSLIFLGDVRHPAGRPPVRRVQVLDLRELLPPPPREQVAQPKSVKLSMAPAPERPILPAPLPAVTPPIVASTSAPPAPVVVAPGSAAPAPTAKPARLAAPAAEARDLSATLIEAKPPVYPIDSRRLKEQGTVLLFVRLKPDGHVEEVSVKQSSGFYRLDRAALSAVRRWRWSPTLVDGAPTAVQGVVPIPFVLQA